MADNFQDSITKEGMKIRFELLNNHPSEAVKQAAQKIMLTRKYTKMPHVAEFIERLNGSRPKPEDAAEMQATIVLEELRRCRPGKTPEFDDPVTAFLMSRRWPRRQWACSVLEAELKWWVREFKEAYLAYDRNRPALVIECNQRHGLKQLTEQIGKDMD